MKIVEVLVQKILPLKKNNQTLLIAIDGRGGSGKSTLAENLKEKLENVTIVHLDDFAYPMGGADRQRLLDQIILPLKVNKVAKYQKRDFKTKELTTWHEIQPDGIVIIEGVITLHDLLEKYYDFKIWIECPAEIGYQRGVARDKNVYGIDTDKEWKEKWIPEEDKAIEEQQPQKKADFIVDGTKEF
jgi:uridine kinase